MLKIMKFKFDAKKFEKEIRKQAKKNKFEVNCPNCKLYCWEYSLNELEEMGQIYCNNCDTIINITLSDE